MLDLGHSRTVGKVTAGFLQQQGSWIFLPTNVTFSVSDDKATWRVVGESKNPVVQTERVLAKDFSCALGKASARYVKVASKNVGMCPPWHSGVGDKAWLFIDEVFVE